MLAAPLFKAQSSQAAQPQGASLLARRLLQWWVKVQKPSNMAAQVCQRLHGTLLAMMQVAKLPSCVEYSAFFMACGSVRRRRRMSRRRRRCRMRRWSGHLRRQNPAALLMSLLGAPLLAQQQARVELWPNDSVQLLHVKNLSMRSVAASASLELLLHRLSLHVPSFLKSENHEYSRVIFMHSITCTRQPPAPSSNHQTHNPAQRQHQALRSRAFQRCTRGR